MAFASLTVGGLEMALGRTEAARAHLEEVAELGGRLDNTWLMSAARSQLAALAATSGRLGEARALLRESVNAGEDTEVSTVTLTYSIAAAHLALAEGDARGAATALGAAEGLRRRAGLAAWPTARRGEAELITSVVQEIDAGDYEDAFAAGADLGHREAVALVRRPWIRVPVREGHLGRAPASFREGLLR